MHRQTTVKRKEVATPNKKSLMFSLNKKGQ